MLSSGKKSSFVASSTRFKALPEVTFTSLTLCITGTDSFTDVSGA